MSALYPLAIACVFLPVALYVYRTLAPPRPQLPPGPKGALFIGNVIQMSGNHNEVLFQTWAQKYGINLHLSPFHNFMAP